MQLHSRRWLGDIHHDMHDPNRTVNPHFDPRKTGRDMLALIDSVDYAIGIFPSRLH